MSPVTTVYVPQFGSPLGASQRNKPGPNQTWGRAEPSSSGRRDKRGKERANVNARGENTRLVLKVKLPKLNSGTLSKKTTKEDKRGRGWMPGPNTTKTVSRGGETPSAQTDSDSVGEDVFFFSQRPSSKAIPEKEKAKFAVLRTISKMLEENQLIRQRLVAPIQAN